MQLLSFNLSLYTMIGLWRPLDWSSKRSKFLYSLYTIVATYLSIYLMLNHMIDSILGISNGEEFAFPFFVFLSSVAVDSKVIFVLIRRDNIISVLKILQENPCKPCNDEEREIQEKFNRLIRSFSMQYTILAGISLMTAFIGEVMNMMEGQLPFHVWVPWNCTSFFLFWFTSLQETVAMIIGTVINVASETLLFGFCLQICAQFELLKYRLQRRSRREGEQKREGEISKDLHDVTSNKTGNFSELVAHHLCIIRLVEAINDIFSEVIFIQFFSSVLILCLGIYYMSSYATIAEIASYMTFTICMFVQIFIYCWAGNEVTLQSTTMSEAIFHMDWTLMTISERKDLLMMMKRSTRPVRLTSSFLVTLSLESYANLLKMSYSAFSILQQS